MSLDKLLQKWKPNRGQKYFSWSWSFGEWELSHSKWNNDVYNQKAFNSQDLYPTAKEALKYKPSNNPVEKAEQ